MYFRLEAPVPAIASTLLLPQPAFGNVEQLTAEVVPIKMMDGSTRTMVKAADNKRLYRYDFTLSSEKVEEVEDFVRRYRGNKFRVVWRGKTVEGYLTLNPVEAAGDGRAGGWPGGEAYTVTLEITEK